MDVASALTPLVALKLVIYSFGSLVHLFLMVLILGQRRLRRLEWLLFALMVALFMWNSGNLLALNVGLFYGVGPNTLAAISRLVPFLGFIAAVPLLVHVHAEYIRQFRSRSLVEQVIVAAFYLPLVGIPWMMARLLGRIEMDPLIALRPFVRWLVVWLVLGLAASAVFNLTLRRSQESHAARLHTVLACIEGLLAVGFVVEYFVRGPLVHGVGGYFAAFLMLASIVPSGLVGYSIFRYNFLDLQVRRNLIYSLAGIFALLIYLNVIRRLSGYL